MTSSGATVYAWLELYIQRGPKRWDITENPGFFFLFQYPFQFKCIYRRAMQVALDKCKNKSKI